VEKLLEAEFVHPPTTVAANPEAVFCLPPTTIAARELGDMVLPSPPPIKEVDELEDMRLLLPPTKTEPRFVLKFVLVED
jgi:hypothetical protein